MCNVFILYASLVTNDIWHYLTGALGADLLTDDDLDESILMDEGPLEDDMFGDFEEGGNKVR